MSSVKWRWTEASDPVGEAKPASVHGQMPSPRGLRAFVLVARGVAVTWPLQGLTAYVEAIPSTQSVEAHGSSTLMLSIQHTK